jgi:hypothetical protein
VPAHVIGGSFSGRADNDWRCCFSSWGMFLYEGAYWGQLGAGCLARVSDAQDSDANWWKEDDVDALSGAGTPGSPSWVSITKNTRREERFVQLQPRTCGPAAGFCPWLGQQMTRVCRRCPGRRADEQRGASGTANHGQATNLFSGLARFWLFRSFHSLPLLLLLHSCHPGFASFQSSRSASISLHSLSPSASVLYQQRHHHHHRPLLTAQHFRFETHTRRRQRSCIHSIPSPAT